MSLAEDTNLGELSLTKAIIDAGATESVAGIRSMSRLIDSGHFLYTTSRWTQDHGSASAMASISERCPRDHECHGWHGVLSLPAGWRR